MNSKNLIYCLCLFAFMYALAAYGQNGPTPSNYASIADGSVTEPKIGTNAVTTVKILNGNVTTAKIADANVTEPKLHADVGTIRAIATGTITASTADIVVSIAASKINTAAPKFILKVGGIEHIYPYSHAITSVTDDGTDVTITLDDPVVSTRNWSLTTLSNNL